MPVNMNEKIKLDTEVGRQYKCFMAAETDEFYEGKEGT